MLLMQYAQDDVIEQMRVAKYLCLSEYNKMLKLVGIKSINN